MTTQTNYLHDSLQEFQRKKQDCLVFIAEARDVLREYETYFPSTVPTGNVEASRLSTLLLDQVEEKIKDSSLKILVAGQFKAGKSTVLNAILSEDILPAYSTPCTAVITEINYAEKKKAIISFKKDLDITNLPEDLLEKSREYIEVHAGNAPDLEVSMDELEDYLVIPMSDKEQGDSVTESPYALCHLFYPLEICKNGAQIIDSPGLNEHDVRTKTTMEYVPQADIVLHVLSALQCYSQADRDFLQDIKNLGNFPILFLVNRFDQLNTAKDKEKIKKYALPKLAQYSIYREDGIFFLSAHEALEGRTDSDDEKLIQSGMLEFEKKLGSILSSERTKIKLANIENVSDSVKDMAHRYLPSLKIMLGETVQTLENELAQQQKSFERLEQRRQHIYATFDKGVKSFSGEFSRKLNIFFNEFLAKIDDSFLDSVTLTDRGKRSNEEYGKYVTKEFGDYIERSLLNGLSSWQKTVARDIFDRHIQEIKEETQYDIEEFSFQLSEVRRQLSLRHLSTMIDVSDSAILGTVLGGSVGGGLAASGLFIASRFFLMTLGPAGWAVAGFTTVAVALGGLWMGMKSDEEIIKAVKKDFLPEIKEFISDRKSQWVSSLTAEVRISFKNSLDPILFQIQKALDDTKKPIEEAILTLKGDSTKSKEQKEKIDGFIKKFEAVSSHGAKIVQSL